MNTKLSIDDAPWNKLIVWIFFITTGGMFLDGYIFGSTSVGMSMAGSALSLSPAWVGAVTAAILAGIFFGSIIAGWVADRFGRQKILFYDLVLFVVACAAQFWIEDPVTLLVIRFVIGVAIGAEYAVGAALLAEFAPRAKRSILLSAIAAVWSVGYVVGYFLSYAMRENQSSWQWILAMATVPAVIVLVSRIGAPESPRWLVSKGRVEEARAIVKRYYGADYDVHDLQMTERGEAASYSVLFGPQYRTRTMFAAFFWTAQVTVSFAMLLFLPTVLGTLGLESEFSANVLISATILVGVVLGIYLIDWFPRRPFVIWTFFIMAAFMAMMAALDVLPAWAVLAAFAFYMLTAASSGSLQFVYPPEMFPTEIRSSAIGFAAACSRIGSTISTFVLPVMLVGLGASWTFVILASVSLLGAVASILWAPETRNRSLSDASAVAGAAEGTRASPAE